MKKVYTKPSVVVDTFLTLDCTNGLTFNSFVVGFNSTNSSLQKKITKLNS